MGLSFLPILLFLFLAFPPGYSLLPGFHPRTYGPGERLRIAAVKLTSSKAQYPLEYFHFKFCPAPDDTKGEVLHENLGAYLLGDHLEYTAYNVSTNPDEKYDCVMACNYIALNKADILRFVDAIDEEFHVHWVLDGLPSAVVKTAIDTTGRFVDYYAGFPLGALSKHEGVEKPRVFLNNHVKIVVQYSLPADFESDAGKGVRIVGFEVSPESVKHDADELNICMPRATHGLELPREPKDDEVVNVVFTYSVEWVKSNHLTWATRWDPFTKMVDTQIHWFSIVNSLIIVLFLTGMVAMIMLRTLRADLTRYTEMDAQELEEAKEEYGWKLVHGDVYRPPNRPMLLSVCVGTGVQMFVMYLLTLVFAVNGFVAPQYRGVLVSSMLFLFIMSGIFSGYSSARLYKSLNGRNWRKNSALTALFFPGIVFAIFVVFEIILHSVGSSGAVPLSIFVCLLFVWFGISIPLVFLGSYLGYRRPVADPPVRTNPIPRQIPLQVWYMHPVCCMLMGGVLPFGTVFIELLFILSSIWLHQYYYMFGFLFIVFIVLVVTCAEISIVLCYFQLCSEDYHWWWRSFLTVAFSGVYLMLYSAFYFTQLPIDRVVSMVLYFGYSFIMSLSFALLCGSVGFYSCAMFIRAIYAYIKVD